MKRKLKYLLIVVILSVALTACSVFAEQDGVDSSASGQVVETDPQMSSQNQADNGGDDQSENQVSTAASENQTVEVAESLSFAIVDTDQGSCYDANSEMECPSEGQSFYGQDAQYDGSQPSYTDNGDGTVTDNVTGLMWQQDPGEKMTYQEAAAGADSFSLAGYDDWRLPTIKELYSLIQFDGIDSSGPASTTATPFIDTDYFNFEYGDESAGERLIDSQWATSTLYTSTTMNGADTMFGVNFADGRIKGYPTSSNGPGGTKSYFVIYVRGNTDYGENDFVDNGNSTISDQATGLTWTQNDSGNGMDYEAALNYCESLDTAGSSDWRLPNAKELQSIVDYSRSPDATNSAAIDPIFNISTITNEAGQVDYPAFWSSTTHASLRNANGVYVNFGRGMGYMNGQWIDVHGAGSQRSDPKTGSSGNYPTGNGPQGDAVRVDNYVRCVTDSSTTTNVSGNPSPASSSTGTTETQPLVDGQGQGSQPPSGQPTDGQNQAAGQGQDRPQVDFAAAAAQLGVTEDALRAALGAPPPDFDSAAAELGVSVQDLITALGVPRGGPSGGQGAPPNGGQPNGGQPTDGAPQG